MEQKDLPIFYGEIKCQCEFALIAYNDLIDAINKLIPLNREIPKDEDPFHTMEVNAELDNRIWYSLQNFVVITANISKLFWPNPKIPKYTPRGVQLVTKIGVDSQSPIQSREIRNYFEHFDQELEDWLSTSPIIAINFYIGPMTNLGDMKPQDIPRAFDKDKLELILQGRTYKLEPIKNEIEKILILTKKVTL